MTGTHHRLSCPELDMFRSLSSFVKDEGGATAIEYALIASLIAIGLVTALKGLGTRLSAEFSEISSALK
jgi:pilus assembly protein Flp/PilA